MINCGIDNGYPLVEQPGRSLQPVKAHNRIRTCAFWEPEVRTPLSKVKLVLLKSSAKPKPIAMLTGAAVSDPSMALRSNFVPFLTVKFPTTKDKIGVPYSKRKSVMTYAISSSGLDLSNRRLDAVRAIQECLRNSNCLSETNLHKTVPSVGSKIRGKVRDIYSAGDYLILVTTDRQSAFDRILASVPFKGQVLNQTSLWWFDKTKDITPNAVVSTPDPNVTIAKTCRVFPVEFVVRGFVTGSTSTSLWTVYSKGVRNYCGNILPDGLLKNQRLEKNILTPTTKAADHDVPVSPEEIVEQGLMTKEEFDDACNKALTLFAYGQRVAFEHGLLLVDTKYEFGKATDGSILLIDEVHTPDSSRYWIATSYEERFKKGLEPENIDKEFLRLWFRDNCDPYADKVLPDAPLELVSELAWRYIFLYETITGSTFDLPELNEPIHERITRNVSQALLCL